MTGEQQNIATATQQSIPIAESRSSPGSFGDIVVHMQDIVDKSCRWLPSHLSHAEDDEAEELMYL